MQISIIIPVYNTGELLPKCIESVLAQTHKDLQIILVNDGSLDSSLVVCNEYKNKDNRIVVIDKENGGLSDARNAGLDKATGDYVMFLDSDDYIEKDACKNFVQQIDNRQIDIITGNALRIEKDKTIKIVHSQTSGEKIMPSDEFLIEELKQDTMIMAACFNLYSLKFLKDNKLRFARGLYHEDELFTPVAFLRSKKVLATDIIFYNYIIRENSITKSKDNTKKAKDVLSICYTLDDVYSGLEDGELKDYLYNHMVNFYLNIFQVAHLYKRKYKFFIDKKLIRGKGMTKVNKLRILLFRVSPRVYYAVNALRYKIIG